MVVRSSHPQELAPDIDDVTAVQLATTTQFGLAVDRDLARGDGGFGFTARFDDASQLEELAQPNHVIADRNVSHRCIIAPARYVSARGSRKIRICVSHLSSGDVSTCGGWTIQHWQRGSR